MIFLFTFSSSGNDFFLRWWWDGWRVLPFTGEDNDRQSDRRLCLESTNVSHIYLMCTYLFTVNDSEKPRLHGGVFSDLSKDVRHRIGYLATGESIDMAPHNLTTRTPRRSWHRLHDNYLVSKHNLYNKDEALLWYHSSARGCATGVGFCPQLHATIDDLDADDASVRSPRRFRHGGNHSRRCSAGPWGRNNCGQVWRKRHDIG